MTISGKKKHATQKSNATLFSSKPLETVIFIPTVDELCLALKQKNVIANITPGIFGSEAFVISLDRNATKHDIKDTRELLSKTLFKGIKNIKFAESKPSSTISLNKEGYDQFMENFETLQQERRMSMEAMR